MHEALLRVAWSWLLSKVRGTNFEQGLKIAKCHELLDNNSYKLGPVFYFGMELLAYSVLFSKFRQQEEVPLGGAKRRQQQTVKYCTTPHASMISHALLCAAMGKI